VFSVVERVELVRASTLDPYGRTLAYILVNGKNFSLFCRVAGLTRGWWNPATTQPRRGGRRFCSV
jgi:hypothetical protein